MNDDKELVEVWRAEFQEKCAPMFSNLHASGGKPFYFHKSGEYFFANVESAWQGFLIAKRSQTSAVLPDSDDGGHYVAYDIQMILTAAGIKYTIGN